MITELSDSCWLTDFLLFDPICSVGIIKKSGVSVDQASRMIWHVMGVTETSDRVTSN